ncbi:ribosomal RNA-processing protein 8 [Patella vulgata]|uniref:ribosomal RNA-processing protein 8 n=1 Tax=Patella vulgata TaxID=6465 RepID=UPI00217F6C39|nr:ribosomal RNA-processing protein 8 [Patella vulgata]
MNFGSAAWDETNASECLNTALFGSVPGKKTSVKKLNKKGGDLEKETKQSKEFLKKLKFSEKKKNVKIVSFDVSDDSDGDYDDISKRSKKTIKERQRKKVKKEEEKQKNKIKKKQQLDSDEELYAEIDEETPQIYTKKNENLENIKKLRDEISPSSINKQKNQKKTKNEAKETKAQKRKASNVTIETAEPQHDVPVVVKKSKQDDAFTVQKCQIEKEKSVKKKRKKPKKPKNNSDKDDDKPLTLTGKKQLKKINKNREAVDEKKPQTELKLLDKKVEASSTNKKKLKKQKIKESFETDKTLKSEKKLKVDALEKTSITGLKDGVEKVKKVTKPTVDTVAVNKVGINSAKAKKKKQKNKKKKTNKSNETESNQNGSFDQMTNGKTDTPKLKPNFNKAKLASLFSTRNKNLVTDVQKKKVIDKSPLNFTNSLKEKMSGQLNAARFRYLNEQLYTQTGKEALDMFQTDVEAFDIYHKGFQSQVAKWPVNPLDLIIKSIKNLPETNIIADFGCGNATLAQSVQNKVHSFDLAPLNEFVTVCDVSKVPLSNKTVDVAVFCLSLMGTNLNDFVMEANRVLKPGGLLQIAEVESRIPHTETFIIQIESFGFEYVKKDTSHKMFHLFDFKKVRAGTKSAVKDIKLDPCLYKKR